MLAALKKKTTWQRYFASLKFASIINRCILGTEFEESVNKN